jgi:hypothetical protein
MDRLERYRSNSPRKRIIAHPRCNKILSTGPSTAGNRQTRTAIQARGEKGGLRENTVLNPLHGVQFATYANGKIERWHQCLKADCLRPGCPLSQPDAARLIERFVNHYNTVRLHSAIGYVTPADRLAGRHLDIFAERDRKLELARQNRKIKRQSLAKSIIASTS